MIWLHCGDADNVATTMSLAVRLLQEDPESRVLITADANTVALLTPRDGVHVDVAPADNPTRARAFLDHWKPVALIWVGGPLRPALLRSVLKSKIKATFLNARVAGILAGSARWLPGAARNAVAAFGRILTADGATATRLKRGGVAADTVEATGPILEEPLPLPFDANEMTVMAEAIGTRPVWFAAQITPREVTHMAAAHLAASRKSHRMLLLLSLQDADEGPDAAEILRQSGLQVGVRSDGDDPLPEHQAYVADLPDEHGMWLRLAPLCFIGGTLSTGAVMSPLDPIAIGSAVLHGTRKGAYAAQFNRLEKVQACREIRTAAELGIAIGTLSSPEQAARMALSGWEEITRNAETINTLIRDVLDCVSETRAEA